MISLPPVASSPRSPRRPRPPRRPGRGGAGLLGDPDDGGRLRETHEGRAPRQGTGPGVPAGSLRGTPCIATLAPGDIFGEIALLQDGVRIANAVASEESAVFRLAFVDVQALVAGNPALGEHLRGLAESHIGGAQ